MNDPAVWLQVLDSWHDFFLLAGTAAVTLAGLLFVAMSIHVDALVKPGRGHFLQLSRAVLGSFLFVMFVSLVLLIPHEKRTMVAVQLMVLGVAFIVQTAWVLFTFKGAEHAHFPLANFRRRLVIPILGYGWIVWVGWQIATDPSPSVMTLLFAGVTLLLVNAASTSWELLVRVARIRHSEAEEAARTAGARPRELEEVGRSPV